MSARAPQALHGVVKGLHHVAIAVTSLSEARKAYEGALGLSASEPEYVPDQKVNVLVLYAGAQRIELVEPAASDSPITNFLEKRGPGIHHLAFQVGDCQRQIEALADAGAPLLDQAPRKGAHDCKVAFVHPKHLGGVLAELVEDPHAR